VVDDHLVHAVGPVRGLGGVGELFARLDVSESDLVKARVVLFLLKKGYKFNKLRILLI
jgi:hypothetical protein